MQQTKFEKKRWFWVLQTFKHHVARSGIQEQTRVWSWHIFLFSSDIISIFVFQIIFSCIISESVCVEQSICICFNIFCISCICFFPYQNAKQILQRKLTSRFWWQDSSHSAASSAEIKMWWVQPGFIKKTRWFCQHLRYINGIWITLGIFYPFSWIFMMNPAWIHQNYAVLDDEPLLIQKGTKIWVRHGHLGGYYIIWFKSIISFALETM